jgi:hypothetical protein
VSIGIPEAISGLLAAACVLSAGAVPGLAVGAPLIVAGEMILAALDQRRVLAEQSRTLRRVRRRFPASAAGHGTT